MLYFPTLVSEHVNTAVAGVQTFTFTQPLQGWCPNLNGGGDDTSAGSTDEGGVVGGGSCHFDGGLVLNSAIIESSNFS